MSRPKGRTVTVTCCICGAQHERVPSRARTASGLYTCRNSQCTSQARTQALFLGVAGRERCAEGGHLTYARVRATGIHDTPEWRARASRQMARQRASGQRGQASPLEITVADVLDRLGLEYVQEHVALVGEGPMAHATSFDFYLPAMGVALEVNSSYWHADPRVYDQCDLTAGQAKSAEAWVQKQAAAEQHGLRICVVWEVDLARDAEAAVTSALGLTSGAIPRISRRGCAEP